MLTSTIENITVKFLLFQQIISRAIWVVMIAVFLYTDLSREEASLEIYPFYDKRFASS